MVNDTKLAYFAGLIDGEGCITYWLDTSMKYVKKNGTKNRSVRINVFVVNTNILIIRELQSIANALCIPYKLDIKTRECDTHRTCWRLSFDGSKRVKAILTILLPWLIGKREQALIALSVIEHRAKTRGGRHQDAGQVLPEEDQWLMSQLGQWRELNQRGVQV